MKIWGLFAVFLLVLVSSTIAQTDPEEDDIALEDLPDPNQESTEQEPEKPDSPKERPVYSKPVPNGNTYLAYTFDDPAEFEKKWIKSEAKKDDSDETIAKYDGVWAVEEPMDNAIQGDLALVLKSQAKHHAISSMLDKPFVFDKKPFVAQYEVRFQNGIECGGAYIKLLSDNPDLDLKQFRDKTPYTIMFGPDKCGLDYKFHFIFRHKHPRKGQFEEKHAKKPSASIDKFYTDKKTHLYTLVLFPDNTFEMYIDQGLINSGHLLQDFTPAVNPAKEIIDPNDRKPTDWDDREKIPDPEAVKPEDWDENAAETIPDSSAEKPSGWLDDEPELIADPEAQKPTDWDDDMDGDWEAPMINNPKCTDGAGCGEWKPPMIKNPEYKGKWKPPMIDNPSYKGKWAPRMIPNPDYFDDKNPFRMTTIKAVGLELWSMSDGITFDNFIITDSKNVADDWAAQTWAVKIAQEGSISGASVIDGFMHATNERPWLWGVLVIVLLIPVVLLSIWCCPKSGPIKPDALAERKKTDEPSPDDDEQEENVAENGEEEEENDEAAGGDSKENNQKKSKGHLEADDDSSTEKSTKKRHR
ncbi:calnexin-like isoform X2 [Tubulanus polymorphus]|uniref:calnexin-like isoform X2 n=1 Tax=Tubulanus polymorphus TaxID=672921 RepID=UPI003DA5DA8D